MFTHGRPAAADIGAPVQVPLHFISYFATQKLAVVPTALLNGTGIKFVGQLALLIIVISDARLVPAASVTVTTAEPIALGAV
ncbi:MAG: hypothetical protein JNJ69_05925 [Leptospiraceae bacterium]|nr:hypothetical protein [Leptospiraceae bacterium]